MASCLRDQRSVISYNQVFQTQALDFEPTQKQRKLTELLHAFTLLKKRQRKRKRDYPPISWVSNETIALVPRPQVGLLVLTDDDGVLMER